MSSNYLKSIAEDLMGEYVEIYQGNDHRQHIGYADSNHNVKSVIYGKLIEIREGCLILEVKRGDDVGKVYVNPWSVETMCATKSGLSIEDAYRPSTDNAGKRQKRK